MRRSSLVGAVVVLIGGSATYAVVDRHTEKVKVSAAIVETPRVETARLFAPGLPPTSESDLIARDLIAAKLASQPIVLPDAPKPGVKATEPAARPRQKQAQKPKPKKSKPALVTGSLRTGGSPSVRLD
jgi:hypothetical protein